MAKTQKKIVVIGGGFSGLVSACFLAKNNCEVILLEKNSTLGGRARQLTIGGFTFDMGPSWYWMPDVFENFFKQFGKTTADFYALQRLNPSYAVKFEDEFVEIPADLEELKSFFEKKEKGAAKQLDLFLEEAAFKYQKGINELVYKPSTSLLEFADWGLLINMLKMQVFVSIQKHIKKHFKDKKLVQLLEFPVLFLGATADRIPALYSLMNYADMCLGTWYPQGGMYSIVQAMESLAISLGVKILTNQEVTAFEYENRNINKVITTKGVFEADVLVASADYQHIEQHILEKKYRNYSPSYWDKKELAPSALIYYLGIDKSLPNLLHHNLFFDEDFAIHSKEIYQTPNWPSKPLMYISITSKTDDAVAPKGCENVMILIPVATYLVDNEEIRKKYLDYAIKKLENHCQTDIKDHIKVCKSYAHQDFINDYHAFKGNAYGLANVLRQTAILKPSIKNCKLKNLYFTGQLTVPGPGVPPAIISGEVVAKEIIKKHL